MTVPAERAAETADRVTRLMAMSSCSVPSTRKRKAVDVRRHLETLEFEAGVLEMRLAVDRSSPTGPRDVLVALGLSDLEQRGVCLARTRVELHP